MGFVEDNIMDGENIIYQAKLHRIIFLLPCILLLQLIGIPLLILAMINYRATEFVITDKRILAKYGFIRRTSAEILLTKIEGIIIDQGVFGRWLDYGTVIISGTGGLKNSFKQISNPLEFRKRVQDQISSQN